MKKPDKVLMRLLAFLLCLPLLLCAMFSVMAMAEGEVVDVETYNGLVILEDPALIGSPEEDEAELTGAPASDAPTDAPTDAPATDTPTVAPTDAPTDAPTVIPTLAPTKPPSASYDIAMTPPSGWYANRAAMEITITDVGGTGWSNVKITMNSTTLINGELSSGHLWIDLLDNCTIEVVVTDSYGKEHTQSVEVNCFDHDAPLLKASIHGEYLHIETSDAKSGVGSVQVNGTHYDSAKLIDGKLDIHLKEYADAYEQLLVQVVDKVGNTSKAIALANPFFHNTPAVAPTNTPKPANTPKPTKKPSSGSGGSGSSNNGSNSGKRATPTPTVEPTPTATVALMPVVTTPILTEVEAGTPFSSGGNAFTRDLLYDKFTNKQFIAIETRGGDIFYMVIDYDKPLDDKGEKYETYFLNLVDSRDLMDIVDAKDVPNEPEVIYVTPEPTVVPTSAPAPATLETPKKGGGGAMLGLIGILLAAAGGALWYFKFRKLSSGKGSQRIDDYGFDDEDEENEDE